jgi:hypothetical protein
MASNQSGRAAGRRDRRPDSPDHVFLDFDLRRIHDHFRLPEDREFRVPVRRPEDLLVFDLIFENLRLVTDPPRLERLDAGAKALLIVELPPQSFAEQAFLEASNADAATGNEVSQDPDYPPKNVPTAGETIPPLPSAKVRMAGRSRLAFTMPDEVESLGYDLASVLEAMRSWPLRLGAAALPDPDRIWRPWHQSEFFTTAELAQIGGLWTATSDQLVARLAAGGLRGIERAIGAATSRVAEAAVAGLAGAGLECQGPALQGELLAEMAALGREFPALRAGPAREAALAALALGGAGTVAAHSTRLAVDIGILGRLPLLPLLIAPHEPPADVTALELPYRLLLSPIESARFVHQDLPILRAGRTELWHTRLTTRAEDWGRESGGKVRALWSPDYPIEDFVPLLDPAPLPFRTSLDPLDRKMLVKLMAGYDERRGRLAYRPRSSRAERLHLTSLGALLDAEGNWSTRPTGVDLEQWRHLANLGRDHYVRVVYAGYLCPFGHAASLVKVTERKFESLDGDPDHRVAVLRQRFFIVCRERVRSFSGSGHEFGGRNFPFTEVEVLTRVTPDLLEPGQGASRLEKVGSEDIYEGEVVPRMAFWPMLGAPPGSTQPVDFRFEVVATDRSGARVSFAVPLLFVGEVANDLKDEPIRAAYNDAGTVARRRSDLGAATVTYAPFSEGDKGDPRLPTSELTFAAGDLKAGIHHALAPNFYPEFAAARVGVPALQKLLGQPDAVVAVTYPQVYKQHGFGEQDPAQNKGQVFLQLIDAVHDLAFGGDPGQAKSDTLGSLASPQMAIQGLSRVMGPVAASAPADPSDPAQIEAALGKVIGDSFDPADFFSGAKILGGIELADILEIAATLAGSDVPKLLSRELPDRIEASFSWETAISKSDPLNLFIPNADGGAPPTQLVMEGLMTTPLGDPAAAHFRADAELNNFKVNLFGFVIIWFENLRFTAEKGQKPDVAVELREGDDAVQFGGPLEFVNTLREMIPSNGFSDPPALTITPSGIAAGYSLTLPTIGVGVFSLSNLSLGAGFELPFDSKPASVKFNFSTRPSPFSLTISFLGGGGFFGIGISTRGVNEIEAALEFGAGVAIDLGVASGSVEVKAGVYFHWLEPVPDQGSTELTGYVRLHGELSILGLISASLTFNLQLSYLKEAGESIVWGEATLTIEVEVLFFSASVEVRCRREFGGSESDPKFIEQIPDQEVWTGYCEAFAEEAV